MNEMTQFYEQGKLIECDEDYEQAAFYVREDLREQNKPSAYINDALSYLKQGFEDAPKSRPSA